MDRIVTAIAFILVGPPAGALWLLCWFFGLNLAHGGPDAYANALESLPILMAISYPAGFLPAFVTAIAFVSLPAAWRRVVVALFMGAIATFLFWQLARHILGGPRGTPDPQAVLLNEIILVSAGAVAAATSTFVAQLIVKRLTRLPPQGAD